MSFFDKEKGKSSENVEFQQQHQVDTVPEEIGTNQITLKKSNEQKKDVKNESKKSQNPSENKNIKNTKKDIKSQKSTSNLHKQPQIKSTLKPPFPPSQVSENTTFFLSRESQQIKPSEVSPSYSPHKLIKESTMIGKEMTLGELGDLLV
jgi:hypothetical protein